MGYSSRDVIHGNRRLGYFPEPDDYGTTAKGRRAPLWKRSTVWAAADGRPGMGGGHRPGTPGAPAKPHPYAGDERLARVLADLRSGGHPSAGGPRRGVGRQPVDRRADHPRGQGRPPGLKASQKPLSMSCRR